MAVPREHLTPDQQRTAIEASRALREMLAASERIVEELRGFSGPAWLEAVSVKTGLQYARIGLQHALRNLDTMANRAAIAAEVETP